MSRRRGCLAVSDGCQLLRIIERPVQHPYRASPAASTCHRRRPGEHSERLQLGPFGDPCRAESTLCRQLRKMEITKCGCQYERVIGRLSKESSGAEPFAAVTGGQVNL